MYIKKKTILLVIAFVFIVKTEAYSFIFQDTAMRNIKKVVKMVENDSIHAANDAKQKETAYDKLMKEEPLSVTKGMFTVHHIKDRWYFEIPDSLIGRYFLASTRYTTVPQNFGKYGGESLNTRTFYFEKRDKEHLLIRTYVLSQESNERDCITENVKKNTIDPIVELLPIVQGNKLKNMNLIDATSLFTKDNSLMSFTKSSKKLMRLGSLQTDRTFIDTIKTYAQNVEVVTTRTYGVNESIVPASSTGYITLGLNTSIVILPKYPMRKRLWDERVGYFVKEYTIFSDKQHKTQKESLISRYQLIPKDIEKYLRGELVEPIKPIVFYIDPATPKKWIPYLIKGINDWNVAFEAAGFKNAIMGKEWPNDSTMSVDDARFSMIRYLPSEIENAYGPNIIDPRSGEIIEAHVCWYHNVMNLLTKWYMTQCGPLDKRAQTMNFDEELMGNLIRFVSSHEVGHSLGLRHNMGASYATPVEKLRNKQWVEQHGHTVSIMDYARFNYVAQPEDSISPKGLFPRINDYDKWAIKWGYQYRPELKDEFEEKAVLRAETTETLRKNPQLWFGGEGRDEDPRSQMEDLGNDNVLANEYGIKNLKRVISNLLQWTYQEDGQYENLIEVYNTVRQQFKRYSNHVLKHIGGRYLNNLPDKKPFEIASAETQKKALGYLQRHVFDAPLWLYPSNITEKTGTNMDTEIMSLQKNVLATLMSHDLLNRLYSDSFVSSKAYRLNDYLNDLFAIVWKPLNQDDGRQKRYRRELENSYLDILNNLLNPIDTTNYNDWKKNNSDLIIYLLSHLDKIEKTLKQTDLSKSNIQTQQLHHLLNKIKQIRERRFTN